MDTAPIAENVDLLLFGRPATEGFYWIFTRVKIERR